MDPEKKRKIRLVVALSAAVLLATALVYTSFSASSEAKSPSELLSDAPTGTVEAYGKVVTEETMPDGSREFVIADPEDESATVPVTYEGQVPDPFREGRDVIVTGEMVDGTLVAQKDSLITKCPSKFSDEAEDDPNIVIDESL
ncbi:MAG TPA: cytochrome c maturation protein CcmE [Solirubrobacterales bacterium]|nr:cytochrome c maturation protein CcmE [Solirubrobacterales bacterium]